MERKANKVQNKFTRLLEIIFVVSGIFCIFLSAFLIFQRYYPKTSSFQNINAVSYSTENVLPLKIAIPSLDIALKIVPAKYINGNFQTITDGISYLDSTPIPGDKGNSILYGHNWTSLLGSLPKIKTGDEIKIVLTNGQTKTFVVKFTTTVDPSQTQILAESSDSRITIYTCNGFLDSKRFVAVAFPVK